jgi:tRNA(fMet)-specific endonuclease VapC
MLDTNILIYLLKHKPPSVANTINALDKDAQLSMPFIS